MCMGSFCTAVLHQWLMLQCCSWHFELTSLSYELIIGSKHAAGLGLMFPVHFPFCFWPTIDAGWALYRLMTKWTYSCFFLFIHCSLLAFSYNTWDFHTRHSAQFPPGRLCFLLNIQYVATNGWVPFLFLTGSFMPLSQYLSVLNQSPKIPYCMNNNLRRQRLSKIPFHLHIFGILPCTMWPSYHAFITEFVQSILFWSLLHGGKISHLLFYFL